MWTIGFWTTNLRSFNKVLKFCKKGLNVLAIYFQKLLCSHLLKMKFLINGQNFAKKWPNGCFKLTRNWPLLVLTGQLTIVSLNEQFCNYSKCFKRFSFSARRISFAFSVIVAWAARCWAYEYTKMNRSEKKNQPFEFGCSRVLRVNPFQWMSESERDLHFHDNQAPQFRRKRKLDQMLFPKFQILH